MRRLSRGGYNMICSGIVPSVVTATLRKFGFLNQCFVFFRTPVGASTATAFAATIGWAAIAQDFTFCVTEAEENEVVEVNHRDHTLGYVSFETQVNKKSVTEITYTFMDCATGDTVYVDFLESNRKKKNIGGTNVTAMAIAVRDLIADTQPSWGNNMDRLVEELVGIGATFQRAADEPLTCGCRMAYPEIER
ncbi:MAG: hypothetical protein AAGJ34_02925 [Pseudomonadota bacterium]